MHNNDKLISFVKEITDRANSFYEANPRFQRFNKPSFYESQVQERIMRLGIESRVLELNGDDELYQCAVATLHNDYIKYANHG